MKTLRLLRRALRRFGEYMDVVIPAPVPAPAHVEQAPERFRCSVLACPFEGVWFPRNLRGAVTPVCSHDYNVGIAEGAWSELDDRDNWNTRKG